MGKIAKYLFSLSFLVIFIQCCSLLILYDSLPSSLGLHSDFEGNFDAIGHKSNLWIIPSISMVLFFAVLVAAKNPHKLNYGTDLEEENKPRAFHAMKVFLGSLSLFVSLLLGATMIPGILDSPVKLSNSILMGLALIIFVLIPILSIIYFRMNK